MMTSWPSTLARIVLLATAACSARQPQQEHAEPAQPQAVAAGEPRANAPTAPELEQASGLFAARCALCHGQRGLGDGPMSGSLRPPPRSFADKAWQKKATDADIAKIIVVGGREVGRSSAMPAAPDLAQRPDDVAGLVALVRHFGR